MHTGKKAQSLLYNLLYDMINSFICIQNCHLLGVCCKGGNRVRIVKQLFYFLAQRFSTQIFFLQNGCCTAIHKSHCVMVLMILRHIWGWNQYRRAPLCLQFTERNRTGTADHKICCCQAIRHIVDVLADVHIGVPGNIQAFFL